MATEAEYQVLESSSNTLNNLESYHLSSTFWHQKRKSSSLYITRPININSSSATNKAPQNRTHSKQASQPWGKMKPIDDKKDKVVIKAVSRDEEGKKRVEKAELKTHNVDTVKYVEKKLTDKGILRMERHPVDGRGGIGKPPPKSGRGGKYTWEGPYDEAEIELEAAARPAIDEKDPNYEDEEVEEKMVKGEEKEVADLVVGEVEVAKAVEERDGVARVEVDPRLIQG